MLELLAEVLIWLYKQGRIGGLLGILLFVLLLVGAVLLLEYGTIPVLLAVGAFLVFPAALFLFFKGSPEKRSYGGELPPIDPQLSTQLDRLDRPFYLCTRCRALADGPCCARCMSEVDCLEIRTDEDLRLARAAMS